MDLATLLGIVVALSGILLGQALEGGSILQIMQPTAAFIVFGGTIGATMISFPLSAIQQALRDLMHLIKDAETKPNEIINEIVKLTNKARREGIIALEKDVARLGDDFFRRALAMAVDGCEPKELREAMECQLQYIEERREHSVKLYDAAGSFAPTIGIIGAVLGLIQVMQHLDNVLKYLSGAHIPPERLSAAGMANIGPPH